MAVQGSYPLNGRQLQATDTVTGVVTGATADIPLSVLAAFVIAGQAAATSGPTANRPNPPAFVGQGYFDTTLGYMVWCNQISAPQWVNAAGVLV